MTAASVAALALGLGGAQLGALVSVVAVALGTVTLNGAWYLAELRVRRCLASSASPRRLS